MLLALKTSFFAAKDVYISEPGASRRGQAERFGASKAFDPLKEDVVIQVKTLTKGKGVDVVFDCSGLQSTV